MLGNRLSGIFAETKTKVDLGLGWLAHNVRCSYTKCSKRFHERFGRTDLPLVLFSFLSYFYVAVVAGHPDYKALNVAKEVLLALGLVLVTTFFASWYRRRCRARVIRRSDQLDPALAIFLISTAALLYPLFLQPSNFSPFQVLFATLAGAIIGWASYFDGRHFYGVVDSGMTAGFLKIKLTFYQTFFQQILWFYGFVAITIILGLDKTMTIMAGNDTYKTVSFIVGMVIVMVDFHVLMTARIILRCEQIMDELSKRTESPSSADNHLLEW